VVGAERDGIPPEIEAQCDASVAIPLYGLVTSLNVATATAIVLHSAVEAYAATHPEFEPVRWSSRRLMGLPKADYSDSDSRLTSEG
jgi:tRNA C32,U32 (ribose-2'-O)-methylase TrmJ